MGRIEHEQCAHRVGNTAERLGFDDPGISGGPSDDEFRPMPFGQLRQRLEVDPLVTGAHPVADEVVPLAAHVHRATRE